MILELAKYLDFDNGFFIEAGANNGFDQSNTLELEKRGWTGLLVEPNYKKFLECRQRRANCIVENYALVSFLYKKTTIAGCFCDESHEGSLTGSVCGDIGDWMSTHFIQENKKKAKERSVVEVPAIALSSLLEKHGISKIDFLSLDVEGYEISVLNGINWKKHSPKYILVETSNREIEQKFVKEYLTKLNYSFITAITGNDDLFKLTT